MPVSYRQLDIPFPMHNQFNSTPYILYERPVTMKDETRSGKVYFIGAGPGAADLITLRGKNIIDKADCIIYAGSLVNKDLFTTSQADIYDSSGLNLEEIIDIIKDSVAQGDVIARVHTGDPSLFGATMEQMVRLESLNIDFEMIPGVSSAFGAAAALGAELTLPELTQTVIVTRKGGQNTGARQ